MGTKHLSLILTRIYIYIYMRRGKKQLGSLWIQAISTFNIFSIRNINYFLVDKFLKVLLALDLNKLLISIDLKD